MTDTPDIPDADVDAQVRALLAAARHDGPMPPDVAARLIGVLAELAAERETPVAVPPLPRRRFGPGLLAAAAVVVALAVGVPQVVSTLGGGSESDQLTSQADARARDSSGYAGPEAASVEPQTTSPAASAYANLEATTSEPAATANPQPKQSNRVAPSPSAAAKQPTPAPPPASAGPLGGGAAPPAPDASTKAGHPESGPTGNSDQGKKSGQPDPSGSQSKSAPLPSALPSPSPTSSAIPTDSAATASTPTDGVPATGLPTDGTPTALPAPTANSGAADGASSPQPIPASGGLPDVEEGRLAQRAAALRHRFAIGDVEWRWNPEFNVLPCRRSWWATGARLGIVYADQPSVLVFRPPKADRQRVLLYRCGESTLVAATTIAAPGR